MTRIVRVSILKWGLMVGVACAGPAAAEEQPAVNRAAAEQLPPYELMGMPITHVQMQVLGTSVVREQPPAPTLTLAGMPASPHQLAVLTRRSKLIAVEAAQVATPTVSTH